MLQKCVMGGINYASDSAKISIATSYSLSFDLEKQDYPLIWR